MLNSPSGVPHKLFLLLQQSSHLRQSPSAEEAALKEMQAKSWLLSNKDTYSALLCSSPSHPAHITGSLLCPALLATGSLQENKKKRQNQMLVKYFSWCTHQVHTRTEAFYLSRKNLVL